MCRALTPEKVREFKEKAALQIVAVEEWPRTFLRLRTQPWVAGDMRFAELHQGDRLTVFEDGEPQRTYGSLMELVDTWAVD